MKRFRRLPSIEQLEEKRLKAADLANCAAAHDTEFVEAADAEPNSAATSSQLRTSKAEQGTAVTANLTAEESDDEDDEENETDDTDETDNTETDESDDDDDSDDEEDDSEEDDSEEDDSEEDDSEEDDSEDDDSEDDDSEDDDSEDDDSDGDDSSENETELSTSLTATTGNSGTGEAEFESETEDGTTEREFSLEVKGAMTSGSPATGTQEVRVGGVLVGSIGLTNGNGKLEFSSDPDDDETSFPANFPTTVNATTVVAVGPQNAPILTGTLGTSSSLQSLAASRSVAVSGSQSPPQAGLFADESQAMALTAPASMSATASTAAAQKVDETNLIVLNLLDAGFAAAGQSMGADAAPHSDDLTSETDGNGSQSLDAVFESLAEGELAWSV